MDKPVFDKGLILPDKLICLSKTRESNARGSAQGMLMHSPRGRDKIVNAECPTPGTDNVSKCPAVAGQGGMDIPGID